MICATLIVEKKSFLVKTVDTTRHPQTADYLATLTKDIVKDLSNKSNVNIKSFVIDNAANMASMKNALNQSEDK